MARLYIAKKNYNSLNVIKKSRFSELYSQINLVNMKIIGYNLLKVRKKLRFSEL